MTTKLITEAVEQAIKTAGGAGGVAGNGINIKTLLDKAEGGDGVGVGAATVAIAAGIAGTAHTIIEKSPEGKWAKGIVGLGAIAGVALAYQDYQTMKDSYTKSGEINLKDALSFAGNALAVAAGIALIANPAGATVAALTVGSVAFAGASLAVDKETDLFNNDIKDKLNDIALGKPIQDFFDNQVGDAVEKMLENREKLGELVDKIKDEITNSENHSPTKLLEKLLTPIMEFGISLSKDGDKLSDEIGDIAKKAWEFTKEVWDKIADWLENPTDWLPDIVKDWLDIPRTGEYYVYDPLTLDLNGNGIIDVIGTDGYKGALFDHDGDGIATATSWVSGADGLLVLDRNGDGVINSGRELFGDSTLLSNGSTARHGYEALAEFDDNGDGVINADDEIFSRLKVWQDKNGDGISTQDEMTELDKLGIDNLSLTYRDVNKALGKGVTVAQQGTYTKDGAKYMMADLQFEHNSIYSRYTDSLELSDAQKELPNLKGMGRLRDLRQASALSENLTNLLTQYQSATTKTAQLALLPALINAWAETDPSTKDEISDIMFSSSLTRTQNSGIGLTPSQVSAIANFVIDPVSQKKLNEIRHKIDILDSFTGTKTEKIYITNNKRAEEILKSINTSHHNLEKSIYHALLTQTRLSPYLEKVALTFGDNGLSFDYNELEAFINAKYQDDPKNAFVDLAELLVYGGVTGWGEGRVILAKFAQDAKDKGVIEDYLALLDNATTAKLATQYGSDSNDLLTAVGMLDKDILEGHEGNDTLIAGSADSLLIGGTGSDTYIYKQGFGNSVIDNHDTSHGRLDVINITFANLADINYERQGESLVIRVAGESGTITVRDMFAGDELTKHIDQIILKDGVITLSDIKKELLKGTDNNDTIIGFGSDDIIHAGAGDDIIEGRGGNDIIYAGDGNNRINAGAGDDIIHLLSGNNHAYGGDGDDIIYSGIGNDKLEGGIGSDVYVLGKNFGKDEIINFNPNGQDKDVIKFTDGILLSHLDIKRTDNHLIINQKGTTNSIKVTNFFERDALGDFNVQQIIGADGNYLTVDQIKAIVMQGTADDDNLYAYSEGSRLDGKEGSDRLIGNAGNDTLIGGTGNDTLNGGAGNDTYLFELGDGKDTINSRDNNTNKIDSIVFGENINPEQVTLKRIGNNLVISYSEQDQVTVQNFFDANGATNYRIDQIKFADGTIWHVDDIKDKVLQATQGDDVIQGYAGDDTLTGLDGNDRLIGNAGNDTLIGGAGNDRLEGGEGNNTYIFSLGDGKDTIYSHHQNKHDIIEFTQDIHADKVLIKRDYSNLVISYSEQDQITVERFFGDNGLTTNRINQVKFTDGTIWTADDIKSLIAQGTSHNDNIWGYDNEDDVIYGQDGNDNLYGKGGNDTLIGGAGNDTLNGGAGDDTYVFEGQWGQDIISDNAGTNQIRLEGVSPDNLHLFKDGNALVIKQLGTDNKITINHQFADNENITDVRSIQSIIFDKDVVWDANAIKQKAVIGTDDDNIIHGFSDDDVMLGGIGNDTLIGNTGNDTLIGGAGNDTLNGGAGDDTYVFEGQWGQDIISDNAGTNQIRLEGVSPSDVYLYRDNAHLMIKQLGSENSIQILHQFDDNINHNPISSILFADGTIWESSIFKQLAVIGTQSDDVRHGFDSADIMHGRDGNDTLYGEGGDDILYGEDGNDVLDGGLGADRLLGGAGNDTYHVNESGDEVIENAKEGEDIVISEIDYTLTQNVENLTLTNNQQAITATGNNLNNILTGNTFNNILDGREGIDTMIGGLGDDTYYVDNTLDIIIEETGEGYDSVIASSDYTLSEHVENLTLVGDAIVAIGNDLDNILIGNEKFNRLDGGHGDDTLDGGLGADTMIGGLGNDTYHVDNALDVIIELPDEGYDTIISQVDYTLVKNVERIILEAGSNATHATGNELDNHIIGNETDNVIDGGMGADLMDGGLGDDYYVVDNEFDNVVEQFDGGIDTVEQHIDRPFYGFDEFGNAVKTGSYNLLFNDVENLILKGEATKAFGNDLDNIITLNNKDNFVNALSGNDTIIYQKGGGRDTILSTDSLESKDALVIHGYDLSEAMFVRVTNTASNHDMLQIRFKGTNDQITLIDYFAEQVDGFDNRMDEITFTKGGNTTTLSQSEFEAKIFAQTNNHAPWVNKHPRPIKGEIGKALSITFDKDTIKDADAYDSELSYRLTLASTGADGRYEPLPD
ncbi:calcium-binding protein [Moraxella bovis]|nr:calcium-binding protein [Moraxella bovis]OOR89859.1 hypothetical protein B0182_06835 [Moraxella bovis]UZA15864.1 calcium-binding protein [Moraxella bovis]